MVNAQIGRRPVSRARQEQVAQRRSEILMAASALIAREGIGGLSMRVLARAVGLTAPTLYGYFASKEAVVEALAAEKVAIMRDYLLREAAGLEPGLARLLAFARAYRRMALGNSAFYHMVIERTGPLAGVIVPSGDEESEGRDLVSTLARDVEHAVERGEIGPVDPEHAILGLWATAHGYVSLEMAGCPPLAGQPAEAREAAYLHAIRAMLRGLEATAAEAASHDGGGSAP